MTRMGHSLILAMSRKIGGTIDLSHGALMNQSKVGNLLPPLNAVALQNAVLCANCEVVSDSPHDTCMVCGSRSLVNICRILGGKMPKSRAKLLKPEKLEVAKEVLRFRRPHRLRHRLSG
jgi:hypothetical protein